MSRPEIPLKIMGWHMDISWTDGKTETITDFPDDISQAIDDYLTELEVNRYKIYDHIIRSTSIRSIIRTYMHII